MYLPSIYHDFVKKCSRSLPPGLIGTDLAFQNSRIQTWAQELLDADGVPELLKPEDFVFMMHQGYLLWLFKVNGDPDPIVYGYREGDMQLKQLERFTEFIAIYLKDST
jgi:hypothetical protein